MGGVVYTDDNLITDLFVFKRSLDELTQMDVSVEFAQALKSGSDFVNIRVDRAGASEVMK